MDRSLSGIMDFVGNYFWFFKSGALNEIEIWYSKQVESIVQVIE